MRTSFDGGTIRTVCRSAASVGAAVMLLLMTACTGTKVVAQWKDDLYEGHPSKVFVAGVLDERGPRTLLEEAFVRELKSRGTDAVASYTVFPAGPRPTKSEVLTKVKEAGADAILVVRFLRKEAGDTHTPLRRYGVPVGFDTSWDSYTGMTTDIGVRDVSYDYDVITMDTTLYQASTGNPIWSGLSETTYQGGAIRQIKPFSEKIMKELVHAKIVR